MIRPMASPRWAMAAVTMAGDGQETVYTGSCPVCAIPEIRSSSSAEGWRRIQVPGSEVKLDRTWMSMSWAAASSTARVCRTRAPASASWSISSWLTAVSLRALVTTRGSAVNTPGTSVKMSHSRAPSAEARAIAVASEPPRPSVVTSPWPDMPWNPATSTIAPCVQRLDDPLGDICRSRALPWASSVTIPACAPVSETARSPRSCTAIAASAQDIISPTDSSASSSRGCGSADRP